MKIAHVVARFPPDVGGMGEVVMAEATELQKRGHTVTVFALAPRSISPLERGVGVCVVHLKSLIPGGDAGWVPGLYTALKGFDLVHLHYPFYGGAEFVWLARLLRGQKYIVTYHMVAKPTKWYQRIVQSIYDFLFTKTILKNAEQVLVVDRLGVFAGCPPLSKGRWSPLRPEGSSSARLEQREDPSVSRLATLARDSSPSEWERSQPASVCGVECMELPNGIDTSLFNPDANVQPKKELLFVGNLMPVKGLDILLHTLKDIPEAKLTVVGSGYEEAAYKQMVQDLKLGERVTFVGSVPHDALPKYYREAWATVVPSRAESFSLVTLESMACGTPVVASDVVGIRGKIEDGVDGWLVNSVQSSEFRVRINEVMRQSVQQRKQMGERGVVKVEERYSLEKHVERLVEIYRDVLR